MPKSEKELMIAAINDFVLCFDNTSKISDSQSDNLCKLATGSAFTTRRLYSTAAEVQLVSKNPCVINGIACLPTRQDLLDRSIIISFDFIPAELRKTEKELMEAWEHDRPLIFGALCQAAAVALKNYDHVSEHNLPRMADFAKWVIAGEERLPWEKGQFMETMGNLRAKIVEEALDADPVSMAVLKLMKDRESWSGSPTDLLEVLSACIDQDNKKYPGFPKTANLLSRDLERMSSFLRDWGIQIEKKHSGTRSITLINSAFQGEKQSQEEAKKDAMKKTMGEVRRALPPAPQSEEAIEPHEELMATASDDVDF
jgi:hypothetical protein